MPPQRRAEVAFVSLDRFATQRASGLDGFRQLSNTVAFDDSWWLVAQETVPSPQAALMRSEDGTVWEEVATIPAAAGAELDISRLASIKDALVALGTEGVPVGPDFFRTVAGELKLWRYSPDGVVIPEVVAAEPDRVFRYPSLATSGDVVLVQAESHHLQPFDRANEFDPALRSQIRNGTFNLSRDRGRLSGDQRRDFGLPAFRLPSDPDLDTSRIFRSSSSGEWEEVDFDLDFVGQIVRAPEGGFLVTSNQGMTYTSALGTSWKRNPRSDIGYYAVTTNGCWSTVGTETSLSSIRVAKSDSNCPSELTKLWFFIRLPVIAAVCSIGSPPVLRVNWEGMEITSLHRGHLDLARPGDRKQANVQSPRREPLSA